MAIARYLALQLELDTNKNTIKECYVAVQNGANPECFRSDCISLLRRNDVIKMERCFLQPYVDLEALIERYKLCQQALADVRQFPMLMIVYGNPKERLDRLREDIREKANKLGIV